MIRRGLTIHLALMLLTGCATRRPEPPVGALATAEEQAFYECRRDVVIQAQGQAETDRGAAARTGGTVVRHFTRGASDPFLAIAGLAVGAVYSTGAALVHGAAAAARRDDDVRSALSACVASLRTPKPSTSSEQQPDGSIRNGAAELRSLGVEPPR